MSHICIHLNMKSKFDIGLHLQTIRTAFNVAIGASSEEIKRTAKNALLQMLNTVVKRVTQYPLVSFQPNFSTPLSLALIDMKE